MRTVLAPLCDAVNVGPFLGSRAQPPPGPLSRTFFLEENLLIWAPFAARMACSRHIRFPW